MNVSWSVGVCNQFCRSCENDRTFPLTCYFHAFQVLSWWGCVFIQPKLSLNPISLFIILMLVRYYGGRVIKKAQLAIYRYNLPIIDIDAYKRVESWKGNCRREVGSCG